MEIPYEQAVGYAPAVDEARCADALRQFLRPVEEGDEDETASFADALTASRASGSLPLFFNHKFLCLRYVSSSSPIWTVESSNDPHGPWLSRTLSIVQSPTRVSTTLRIQRNF